MSSKMSKKGYLPIVLALLVGSFFSGLIDDVRIYNGVLSIGEIEALAQ